MNANFYLLLLLSILLLCMDYRSSYSSTYIYTIYYYFYAYYYVSTITTMYVTQEQQLFSPLCKIKSLSTVASGDLKHKTEKVLLWLTYAVEVLYVSYVVLVCSLLTGCIGCINMLYHN